MHLKGKTALVTGGARRIGRAICHELASHGCDLVIHYNRSLKSAGSLSDCLRSVGVRSFVVQGDLNTREGCERVADLALRASGRLDVLINNAAVFHKQPLLTMPATDVRDELELNLFAPLWLIRAFALRTRKGSVLNMLDRRITSNQPGLLPYVLSKKALADLTMLAAMELAPDIRVNAVAPGPVMAPDSRSLVRDRAGRIPLGRRPRMKDLLNTVIFLLENNSITGQIIFVDSGQHLSGGEAE